MMKALTPGIMPTTGDVPLSGLKEAESLIAQTNAEKNAQIILVTDKVSPAAIEFAKSLHQKGIITSVLAVGSTKKNSNHKNYQPDTLEKLASAGGGVFVTITPNQNDVEKIISVEQSTFKNNQLKKANASTLTWQDNGYLCIFIILFIGIWSFRKGSYGLFAAAILPCDQDPVHSRLFRHSFLAAGSNLLFNRRLLSLL